MEVHPWILMSHGIGKGRASFHKAGQVLHWCSRLALKQFLEVLFDKQFN